LVVEVPGQVQLVEPIEQVHVVSVGKQVGLRGQLSAGVGLVVAPVGRVDVGEYG
jgi:hypothetical protein